MKSSNVPTISSQVLGNSLFECIALDASKGRGKLARELPVVVQMGVVCVCLRGSGSFVINEQEYAIDGCSLLTILPNAVISGATSSADFLGYAIAADTKFMMSIQMRDVVKSYVHIKTNPVLKISEQQSALLIESCELLRRHREEAPDALFADDIARHLLSILCYRIHAIYLQNIPSLKHTEPQRTRQNALCQEFFELVESNAIRHRDMGFYADKLCITPKYLSVVVRKASGRSPVEWIDRTVMLYARTLLTSSDMTVQQISAELNFPNPSFFGQYFKRHEGVTPKHYRMKAEN